MRRASFIIFAALAVFFILLPGAYGFGAGNIPTYSSQEGVAFRHGDIADALSTLKKAVEGGLLSRRTKFSGLDIKRIYFGNL